MEKQQKSDYLLSICVPTYNRDKLLYACLLSIFKQMDAELAQKVEVVVSNNCSTDGTANIVKEFLGHANFKYTEQPTNIGLAGNVISIVDKDATGDYCWIIGDDDFLFQGAIKAVVNLLEKRSDIHYFYAKVKQIHVDDFAKYAEPFDTSHYPDKPLTTELDVLDIPKVENLVTPEYSIIFLGEIMASIFRRNMWISYKGNFEGNFLETLETTYPHSVIFANSFFGHKAVYIKTPLILVLDGAREWWDKVGFIIIVHIRRLLDLYREKGLSDADFDKCNKRYIQLSFPYFMKFLFKKGTYKKDIFASKYLGFLASHPLLFSSYVFDNTAGKVFRKLKIK